MDRQEHIDLILDHYENPRHRGPLAQADVVHVGKNPACGDVITIYLKAGDNGQVAGLSFEGQGCTISQAAASMAVEMLQNWTLDQIDETSPQPILELLGANVAATRPRCSNLALDTLKAAGRELRRRQLKKSNQPTGQ